MITQDILERQREFHWESLALRDKMMLPHHSTATTNRLSSIFYYLGIFVFSKLKMQFC